MIATKSLLYPAAILGLSVVALSSPMPADAPTTTYQLSMRLASAKTNIFFTLKSDEDTTAAVFTDSGDRDYVWKTNVGSLMVDDGTDNWSLQINSTPDATGVLFGGKSRGQYPVWASFGGFSSVATEGFGVDADKFLNYQHRQDGVRPFYACRSPSKSDIVAQWYWQGPEIKEIPSGCEAVNIQLVNPIGP